MTNNNSQSQYPTTVAISSLVLACCQEHCPEGLELLPIDYVNCDEFRRGELIKKEL